MASSDARAAPTRASLASTTRDDERFSLRARPETELVASNLRLRLTVLYGPSGVGKSHCCGQGSCGACARPCSQARPPARATGRCRSSSMEWRDDPLAAIASAAGAENSEPPLVLADILAERAAEVGGEIYLVLDQIEEYFFYHGRDRGGPLRDALAEIRPGRRSAFTSCSASATTLWPSWTSSRAVCPDSSATCFASITSTSMRPARRSWNRSPSAS